MGFRVRSGQQRFRSAEASRRGRPPDRAEPSCFPLRSRNADWRRVGLRWRGTPVFRVAPSVGGSSCSDQRTKSQKTIGRPLERRFRQKNTLFNITAIMLIFILAFWSSKITGSDTGCRVGRCTERCRVERLASSCALRRLRVTPGAHFPPGFVPPCSQEGFLNFRRQMVPSPSNFQSIRS